ncbi:putative dna replication licensing factor mcm6 protein [Naviculisporaceae sp. PSN 640]
MSKPILSLVETKTSTDESSATPMTVTPHLLPCRIHHDGSVEPVQSFWDPRVDEDGKNTAYFRGRKLDGKSVKLPEGYRGIIAASATEAAVPPRRPEEAEEEVIDLEREGQPETGKLQVQAEFDEMIIWGHEATADVSADPYVRGMEEWLALADQVCEILGYQVRENLFAG